MSKPRCCLNIHPRYCTNIYLRYYKNVQTQMLHKYPSFLYKYLHQVLHRYLNLDVKKIIIGVQPSKYCINTRSLSLRALHKCLRTSILDKYLSPNVMPSKHYDAPSIDFHIRNKLKLMKVICKHLNFSQSKYFEKLRTKWAK